MDVREKLTKGKRLIDANRAMEIVRDQGIAHPNAYHLTNYAMLILREAPTVDAVPVVRCKDCKYCDISLVLPTGRKMYNCMEGSHDHQTLLKSNDFCSRGERRKDREYIDSEKKGGEEE